MKQWYEKLFVNFAKKYDKEVFTQGTLGECDFIEKEIEGNKDIAILDMGCGTGRHSIELTKRGYNVTGVDLSENMLGSARKKAEEHGLSIDFQQGDNRELSFRSEFDLVIMLCEGGFSLMETDEMNFQILQSAAKALKPGGTFIFTCLNGLFPIFHSTKEFFDEATKEGTAKYGEQKFDYMTLREKNKTSIVDDSGEEVELACNERFYMPSEITWLLKSLGFKVIDIFGATLGAFSREDALKTKDYEMLVVAKK